MLQNITVQPGNSASLEVSSYDHWWAEGDIVHFLIDEVEIMETLPVS